MSKLTFDESSERKYENGVDHAVLYKHVTSGGKMTRKGYVWNGMTSIDVSPDGGETEALWADNIKYAVMRGAVSYAASINCYTFPEEFNECLGNHPIMNGDAVVGYVHEQEGERFSMCYRTALNNAESGRIGYRYHVVYNLACDPADMTYDTINDSPEAAEFTFDVEGTPEKYVDTTKNVTKFACEYTFDVLDTNIAKYQGMLDLLYGKDGDGAANDAHLPDPAELFAAYTV